MSQEDLSKISKVVAKDLLPEDIFTFECTDRCMGQCCQRITIHLDPWDVETMARSLEMPAKDFLDEFCEMEMYSDSRWPVVWMKHAAGGPCAFLQDGGKCIIYKDRPRNCRCFPVGRAVRFTYEGGTPHREERLFLIERMARCLGFEGTPQWSAVSWLEQSEAGLHNDLCDQFIELVSYVNTVLNGPAWLSPATARMAMPVLYGPDLLRAKLGIAEAEVGHEEFYRRRIKALREIFTAMAGQLGFGPRAGAAGDETLTLTETLKKMLLNP